MVYNQQHSFAKFKDISDFKEISLDSLHKRLNDFHKKLIKLKGINPQTKANEDLKAKVLDSAEDIVNEIYYIYKEKYEEKKDALSEKDTKKFDYTKLRLYDDYEYESGKEKGYGFIMNSETNESNRFMYQNTDKLNLKNLNKNMALVNLSIYYTWKNIKSEYKNNKSNISAPTWNDEFDLPDGSYSVCNILFVILF